MEVRLSNMNAAKCEFSVTCRVQSILTHDFPHPIAAAMPVYPLSITFDSSL